MAYRKPYRKVYRRRPAVSRKLQKTRKLAGQKPVTWAETLARSAGPIGHLASSVATIAGLVNSESKYNDIHVDSNLQAVASDNQLTVYVNNIAEGDDVSNRNGRSILDNNLQYRIRASGDESATTTVMGYALVMDKRPEEGVTATSSWSTVFNSSDPASLIDKDTSDRFVILKRGDITLDNSGLNTKIIKGFIPLKGIHTKYSDATSNATGIYANSIFLTATSDHANASNPPHLEGHMRFQYYDN